MTDAGLETDEKATEVEAFEDAEEKACAITAARLPPAGGGLSRRESGELSPGAPANDREC